MNSEEYGNLTTVEITRIIDYLRAIGLTDEQIYGFWVYVATGHLVPDVTKTEK